MSSIPAVVLLDFFPRAGFRWRGGQGSPRVLRSNSRDGLVQRAIGDLCGDSDGKISKRDVQVLVVDSVTRTAEKFNDSQVGIRPGEGIVEFLERSAQFSVLSRSIPENVWVEMIYQVANARYKYKSETSAAEKLGDTSQLTGLAHAIDALVAAAGNHWDWLSLELYAYPHLMGEAVDYDIDDEDEEETVVEDAEMGGDDDAKMGEEKEPAEQGASTGGETEGELPRHMGQLAITDADGDVQMEM